MLSILNRILADRLDANAVMAKLDEIRNGVSTIQGELSARRDQEAEAARIRRTPPDLDAYLSIVDDKVRVFVRSNNLIPFEYNLVIVNQTGTILSGIQLQGVKLYPNKERALFYSVENVKYEPGSYLELRYRFQSLSFEELKLPGHKGEIVRKYKVAPGGSSLIPLP